MDLINSNIQKYGCHIYMVKSGSSLPRFSYSIGLKDILGLDLVLAGASLYSDEEVKMILDEIIVALKNDKSIDTITTTLGVFTLKDVDNSWVQELMLGALDYYDTDTVKALQVLPTDKRKFSIDIPNLQNKYSSNDEPLWQWLTMDWNYDIPSSSMCVTNTDVLLGESLYQAIRWEEDYWEAFSKPSSEIVEEDTHFIPLSFILESNEVNKIIATLSIDQAVTKIDDEWGVWSVNDEE